MIEMKICRSSTEIMVVNLLCTYGVIVLANFLHIFKRFDSGISSCTRNANIKRTPAKAFAMSNRLVHWNIAPKREIENEYTW